MKEGEFEKTQAASVCASTAYFHDNFPDNKPIHHKYSELGTVFVNDDCRPRAPMPRNVKSTSELRQNKLFPIRYGACGAVKPLRFRQWANRA